MTIHDQLGNDSTATEAVNNAITEHGHYLYCGNVNCLVTRLEVWIKGATKEQQGKNDHLDLQKYLSLSIYSISLIMISRF
jgi:hypothetical protein